MEPPFCPCDSSGDTEKLPWVRREEGWYLQRSGVLLEFNDVFHLESSRFWVTEVYSFRELGAHIAMQVSFFLSISARRKKAGQWEGGELDLHTPRDLTHRWDLSHLMEIQGWRDSPYKKPKGQSKLLTVNWEGDGALSDLESICSFFQIFLKACMLLSQQGKNI